MGTVPSDPFLLREKYKVHMYLDSWAVVNGFSCFVKGREGICLDGDKDIQGRDIWMNLGTQNMKTSLLHGKTYQELLLQKRH